MTGTGGNAGILAPVTDHVHGNGLVACLLMGDQAIGKTKTLSFFFPPSSPKKTGTGVPALYCPVSLP